MAKRVLWCAAFGLIAAFGCGGDDGGGAAGAPGASTAGGMAVTGTAGTGAAGVGAAGSTPTGAGSAAAGTGAAGRAAAGAGAAGMAVAAAGTGAAGRGAAGAPAGSGAGGQGSGAGMGAGAPGAAGGGGSGAMSGDFTLSSPVVAEGQMIPKEYRGESASPALSWTAGPEGTKSYAIVFKDVTPGFSMNFMHWVIYDVPASTTSLPMGVPSDPSITMPVTAKQGRNYNRMNGYIGPGAPSGTNMYRFTLYALSVDALPELSETSTGMQVETALEGSSKLGTAVLNVTSMP